MLHFTIVVIYNRRVFKWLVTCHSLESMISHSAKWASVTRLGDYWKFLVTNVLTKVAQIIDDLLGFLKEITFKQKLLGLLYWTTFGWIHNLDYFSLQRLATLANPYLYHHQHHFLNFYFRNLRSSTATTFPCRKTSSATAASQSAAGAPSKRPAKTLPSRSSPEGWTAQAKSNSCPGVRVIQTWSSSLKWYR